ncbi:MAG: N-acetyltransferase [Bacteroidales bacterium]
MEIRKLEAKDIPEVVELWYSTSLIAHNFVEADYWKENKEAMATEYLPNSESYVLSQHGTILGFVSMLENYLAAIFVHHKEQGKGIGTKLLDFIKQKRTSIQLLVFKKNCKSIEFYKKQHFSVLSEGINKETGECDLLMEWLDTNK